MRSERAHTRRLVGVGRGILVNKKRVGECETLRQTLTLTLTLTLIGPNSKQGGREREGESVSSYLMRLWAEWVSCGWRAAPLEEAAPERRGAQEKERLAPGEVGARRRRRSRRAADPWRPSLGDIYEENAATEEAPLAAAAAAAAAAAGPATKLMSAGASARVSPRARSDEFRQLEVTPISPAFTPTAFLF